MELSIQTIKNELLLPSTELAQFLDHRHRTILKDIDTYINEFSRLQRVEFQVLPFETSGGIQHRRVAFLTEDHCYFLLTLMRNNPKVVEAKLKLVEAFRDARKQLAQRDIARIEGKAVRIEETAAIKELVEYAEANGSMHANNYYAAITKMTNLLLGIESGNRDKLDSATLDKIKMIETIIKLSIRDGIKANLPYKDIYQLAKLRSQSLIDSTKLLK